VELANRGGYSGGIMVGGSLWISPDSPDALIASRHFPRQRSQISVLSQRWRKADIGTASWTGREQ